MSVRERVRNMVDALPENDLLVVERMLRGLVAAEQDPLLAALAAAPEDDEPYTEEEQREDEEAIAAYRRGESVSHAELLRRIGHREKRAA